ncbi:hypothetical protein QG37_01819 [Candidozyma auris]|nr:hypothetical protein QG37_01819 [[Candida] auris]
MLCKKMKLIKQANVLSYNFYFASILAFFVVLWYCRFLLAAKDDIKVNRNEGYGSIFQAKEV